MSQILRLIKFLKRVLKKRTGPLIMNFEITSKCNLNCEHCYLKGEAQQPDELSDKKWEEVFHKYKNQGADSAMLTGGEPSLRLNVIKSAYKVFNFITIVTNGVIKIPEDIKSTLFVSIDGPEEVHNKIRNKDVFKDIINNIKNDKRVILGPTLSTTNFEYIEDLVDIARESNVRGILFSMYSPHEENDPLALKGEELEWTINKLKEVREKNKDIFLMSPYMIDLLKTKEHKNKCFMKESKSVVSLDPQLNRKRPCVMGPHVNCNSCGCIVPVVAHALYKCDIKGWILFNKIFPEKIPEK